MTYAVGESQYVAIAAGSDIFTFTLPTSNRPGGSGVGAAK
jgi:hypothetical protein